VLDHYYDVRHKDNFDKLFGDLYIGKNPTPLRNELLVLSFQLSGIDTSNVERFNGSFAGAVRGSVASFLVAHKEIIENYEELYKELFKLTYSRDYVEFAFDIIAKYNRKAYVIIDEYDHFANDMIAAGVYLGQEQYKKTIWAGSQVRDFYETLKDNSATVIEKIFMTGITPIMLDDLTSGFNVSTNLSTKVRYNEILGFTKQEVEHIIDECEIDRHLINEDIEHLYNGYLFHNQATTTLYNSTMIFNYFHELKDTNGRVENLVDYNLRIDYGRLRNLISLYDNKEKLRMLLENNIVSSEIVKQFSIEVVRDKKNFFSLLYYMGLVTIDNKSLTGSGLRIPNYSVKTMYWDYVERMLHDELEGLELDNSKYVYQIRLLAVEGDYKPFFEYFSKCIMKHLSNRDLLGTVEKDIKFLMLPMFFNTYRYFPISEFENNEGYTDIYLRRSNVYPLCKYEWVFEIKYIKQKDYRKKMLIEAAKRDAREQLERYKNSTFFKEKKDVRYLSIVFVGKKEYFLEEV
jgi:hypothetical protein